MYRADVLGSAKEYDVAIALLEPLAKEFEGTLFAAEIWQKLAECYVRVERTPDEIRAYDEVIKRAVVAEGTATPMLNQAEAYMRNGEVDVAVSQFREVYRLAGMMTSGNELGVLAQWDLAVALDRSGDVRGAISAARAAVHMDARCLAVSTMHTVKIYASCKDADIAFVLVPAGLFPVSEENDSVYFVPKYERSWYLALGREALALDGDKPREIAENWKRAETEMMSYMTAGRAARRRQVGRPRAKAPRRHPQAPARSRQARGRHPEGRRRRRALIRPAGTRRPASAAASRRSAAGASAAAN